MSALIRDLGVVNRDCSDLDLIFLKFISWLLFCCSRIAICFYQHFSIRREKRRLKCILFTTFCGVCALGVVSSAAKPRILLTSFVNLPVSGVIINIQKVGCSVSLLLSVVCGNLLSRLQIFITINLVRVNKFSSY